MSGSITIPPITEPRRPVVFSLGQVNTLLDTVDSPLLVAARNGRVLLINSRGQKWLESCGFADFDEANVFKDILQSDAKRIFLEIESGSTR